MSSMSSLGAAISGLRMNQIGLQVTGQNISNVNTKGYTRQRINLSDSFYNKIGNSGNSNLKTGTGVDVVNIEQIRDRFLDVSYRQETGREAYYKVQLSAAEEIEGVLGELETGDGFSKVITQLWESMNELSKNPESIELRGSFVQNAVLFVDRSDDISNQLENYQSNLNSKIKNATVEINSLTSEIAKLNQQISKNEVAGGFANDYRDQRNNALDRLSQLIDISYREEKDGQVVVSAEGYVVVDGNKFETMDVKVKEGSKNLLLIEPTWTNIDQPVFSSSEIVHSSQNKDKGELKSLLNSRGSKKADYTDMLDADSYDKIKGSFIMRTQAQFDNLVHNIVKLINDQIAPNSGAPGGLHKDDLNSPYGLDGSRHIELFTRKEVDRYNADGKYNDEIDISDKSSLYSAGNIEINSDILKDVSKLCLSKDKDDPGDNDLIEDLIAKWKEPTEKLKLDPSLEYNNNISDYYRGIVSTLGSEGQMAKNQFNNQQSLTNQINNRRNQVSGVSTDEELGNMMKYQQAYNANAKVVSVIDSMMEQIVTRLGIVGR